MLIKLMFLSALSVLLWSFIAWLVWTARGQEIKKLMLSPPKKKRHESTVIPDHASDALYYYYKSLGINP